MGLTLDLPNASKPLIEGMFQRIDREGVAKLIEQSQQIETKVRRLWNAEKFEQAATYITDQLSWIHEMTRAYIPEAADEELKLRRYSCWPGGCVS